MDENPYQAPEGTTETARDKRAGVSLLRDVLWLVAFAVLLALGLMAVVAVVGGVALALFSYWEQ